MRKEQWYQERLLEYFEDNYETYEDTIEWYVNPVINQWLFDIPELDLKVELTCDEDGEITEQRYTLPMDIEEIYEILKDETSFYDAVYEDSIIDIIGTAGFSLLRTAKRLTMCGSVNGRTLYTLD